MEGEIPIAWKQRDFSQLNAHSGNQTRHISLFIISTRNHVFIPMSKYSSYRNNNFYQMMPNFSCDFFLQKNCIFNKLQF
jgi:hypothetical protein